MSLEGLELLGALAVVLALAYVARSWRTPTTSTTQSTAALWAKSLGASALFFGLFMVALPGGAHRLLAHPLPLPTPIRAGGGGLLFVAGLAGWLVCLDAFARRGRGTPSPSDAPRHLVTNGPFGVVRNPMIASELIVIWGEALYFASLGLFLYALLITLGAHWGVVRVEEPQLRKRFGEAYEAYCRRVPRWLPRLAAARGGGPA